MTTDPKALAARYMARQASAKTYSEFMYAAEAAFLMEAVPLIKRIAGGHAERVAVEGSPGRVRWLKYEGQDRSDIDLELTFSLAATSNRNVTVLVQGSSAERSHIHDDVRVTWGQLTPRVVADIFHNYFGR